MSKHTSIVREVRGNALWDAIKLIFQLAGGATLLTSALSAILHLLESVSLNVKLIGGMFLCSFLFLGLAFLAGRMRRAEHPTVAPAEGQPSSTSVTARKCPDKWLHDIADRQKQGIEAWVFVQKVEIHQHDLLRESPYIDFRFTIYNASIFRLSFGEVSGSVSYAGQLLGGQPFFVANSAANMGLRQSESFTVRQPLNKEEAVFVLGMGGSFEFNELKIAIKGGQGFAGMVEAKNLNLRQHEIPCNELLAAYPKLDMEIVEAKLLGCYQPPTGDAFNTADDVWESRMIGSLINVHVRFKNPRQKAVNIQGFKLDPHLPIALLAPAERGDIYESPFGRSHSAEPLKNLNNCPFYAEQGQPFEGWLQFKVLGVLPNELEAKQPTVMAVDLSGEEHRRGIPKLQRG